MKYFYGVQSKKIVTSEDISVNPDEAKFVKNTRSIES